MTSRNRIRILGCLLTVVLYGGWIAAGASAQTITLKGASQFADEGWGWSRAWGYCKG